MEIKTNRFIQNFVNEWNYHIQPLPLALSQPPLSSSILQASLSPCPIALISNLATRIRIRIRIIIYLFPAIHTSLKMRFSKHSLDLFVSMELTGTLARNILSTPCWALERLNRGLSDLDACWFCELAGKRRAAGYGQWPCFIPGTRQVRSKQASYSLLLANSSCTSRQ